MTVNSKREDVETLRLKLRRVDDFISVFEGHWERLRGTIYVEAVNEAADVGNMLLLIKESLAEIAQQGYVKSFIVHDLETVREELGDDHQREIDSLWRSIESRSAVFFNASGISRQEGLDSAVLLAKDILQFLDAGLQPARMLRERLVSELSHRETSPDDNPSPKALRRKRDSQIRKLRKEHSGLSWRELTDRCLADPAVQATGQNVTIHIVRDACRK